MGAFIVRRIINYLILMVVAVSAVWALASVSLNPKSNYLTRQPQPSPAVIAQALDARNENPDKPLLERYGDWASGAIRGDFGVNDSGGKVSADFLGRAGVTVRLVTVGTVFSAIGGIALGAFAAVRQYKFADRFITTAAFVVNSIPVFVMAILAQIGATKVNDATGTRFFKFTSEYDDNSHGFGRLLSRADHLILPTIVLAAVGAASYALYQRSTMLDALGSDFLRTARAKGLTKGQAIRRHGLRTAVIPVMTLVTYGSILTFVGAVFTENQFGWHGLGEMSIDAITKNDVNSIAAVSVFTALLVMIAGLLSDIVTAALDPRVRL